MVYRSVERQGIALAKYINEDVTPPDMTFLIDVDPNLAYRRGQAVNRHGPYGLDFLELVRKRYLDLVQQERLIVVDGSKSIEQVTGDIIGHLVPLLGKLK
jgi:thymidylate kinase